MIPGLRSGLLVILCIAVAIGCFGGKQDSLTFAVGGTPNELDFWDSLVTTFQEQSGVAVTLLRQPTDTDQRRQNLVISLKARRSEPDVFLMDVAWIAQFAASGWLRNLELEASGGDTAFFAGIVSTSDRYNGHLIALPVYVDAGVLYYRKDLLDKYELSPPVTWDDLVSQSLRVMSAEQTRDPSFTGFVWQGAQYEGLVCTFLEFAGSGGGIRVADGHIDIEGTQNERALVLMRSLIADHKISPPSTYTEMKEEEARQVFQRGGALFERNWPYAWALHQADESPVKGMVGIAPLPSFPGGQSVSTLGGWHIGVSAYTKRADDALRLVEYVTSHSVQRQLALRLGWNPGRRDVYGDSVVSRELPHLRELRTVFDHARPRPIVPYYSQISDVLQRHLNATLAGTVTPGQALARAQKEAEIVVKRYSGE